jgi:hypothetical protein
MENRWSHRQQQRHEPRKHFEQKRFHAFYKATAGKVPIARQFSSAT